MRAGWGAVAHVFLAVALSLPIAVGAITIGVSATLSDQSWLNRWLLTLLALAFLATVGWAALLPPVRQVEIAAARSLLGVDLPDVTEPLARRSRLAGASWLAILIGVGLVIGLAILYLLPAGFGLIAHPMSGERDLRWPNGSGVWRTGAGWSAAWVAVLGVVALVLLAGVLWLAARLLVRWSVPVLGPTYGERLALAAGRERDLARANALAREVHDTLGHTLTAMTVQVTAARRLLGRDPDAADRALAAVEEHGRRAQADVDAVVGALRSGGDPTPLRPPAGTDAVARLRALVEQSPVKVAAKLPDSLALDPAIWHDLESVVREGLTNAARHGHGDVRLSVAADERVIRVEVANVVDVRSRSGRVGGRGLAGLRERVLLRDGTIEAGPDEGGDWWLRVTLPR